MPKITKTLYRYRSLEYFEDNLNGDIWMQPLRGFSDPFEGICILDFEDPKATETVLKARNHGTLCLSGKNDSPPMWDRYATNHQGVCLIYEVDFQKIKKPNGTSLTPDEAQDYLGALERGEDIIFYKVNGTKHRCSLVKVKYQIDFPRIREIIYRTLPEGYLRDQYVIQNLFGVKSIDWQHEHEYRLVVNDNSVDTGRSKLQLRGYAPFITLTGVILGFKFDAVKKQQVLERCNDIGLPVYCAQWAEDAYRMRLEEVETSLETVD